MAFSDNFKSEYKDLAGCLFYSTLRRGEQELSRETLYSVLKPFFYARATLNCAFRKCGYSTPRPEFLRVQKPARAERRLRANAYLNHLVDFFQDRLTDERWSQNCRVEGLDYLQSARGAGRPVILAFCHFGPFLLLRSILRAKGVPAAMLGSGEKPAPSRLRRLLDRRALLQEVPLRFYTGRLREADDFLAAGNVLCMPIDAPVSKHISVPFCESWTFEIATGAVRLAVRHGADLIPCAVIDGGRWRFTVKLGEPVPRQFLSGKGDWFAAGKHLVDQLIPIFRAWPEQCRPDMIRCLKQNV